MSQQGPDLLDFQARTGCDERALAGLQALPPGDQLVAIDIVENQKCKNPSAVTWRAVQMCQREPARARSEYLRRHLDERATEAFGKLPPHAQEGLCQQMDFAHVKNLSAFVFSQIRKNPVQAYAAPPHVMHGGYIPRQPMPLRQVMRPAPVAPMSYNSYGRDRSRSPMSMGVVSAPVARHAVGGMPSATPSATPSAGLNGFRMRFPVDDGAMRALSGLSPEDQFIACSLVEKQNPRNPSAVAWSMCKLVTNKPAQAKLEYIKHMVDPQAAAALDALGQEELDELLKAELSRVRNVSAFVWSRIKAISAGELQPERPQARVTAQPRRQAKQVPPPSKKVLGLGEADEISLESVALSNIQLDSRCQAGLAELSHEDQMQILDSVDENVRNPSAYVWSKIRSMGRA